MCVCVCTLLCTLLFLSLSKHLSLHSQSARSVALVESHTHTHTHMWNKWVLFTEKEQISEQWAVRSESTRKCTNKTQVWLESAALALGSRGHFSPLSPSSSCLPLLAFSFAVFFAQCISCFTYTRRAGHLLKAGSGWLCLSPRYISTLLHEKASKNEPTKLSFSLPHSSSLLALLARLLFTKRPLFRLTSWWKHSSPYYLTLTLF